MADMPRAVFDCAWAHTYSLEAKKHYLKRLKHYLLHYSYLS